MPTTYSKVLLKLICVYAYGKRDREIANDKGT